MTNYNPTFPYILGNEWVPIRQANYQPDDITERGYTFTLGTRTTIVSGSHSVYDVPPAVSANKLLVNAIYPVGYEDQTGPIQQLIIPVDGVKVTGSGVFTNGAIDFLTPTDNNVATMLSGLTSGGIGLTFDTSSYSNQLSGKRILNLELLYTVTGDPLDLARVEVNIARVASQTQRFAYQLGISGPPLGTAAVAIESVPFSDMNPFWNNSLPPSSTLEVFPWRYTEMQLLDGSASPASGLQVTFRWSSTASLSSMFFGYGALRVTYCEEQRVLYGSRFYSESDNSPGIKIHRFLNTSFQHGATQLAAGDYSITSTFRSLSPISYSSPFGADTTTPPTIHALRQLYEISSLPTILTATSLTPGEEYSTSETDVVPHLLMFTAAGTVTGSHAYGTQTASPVYGITTTVEQEIDPKGVPTTVELARYYARRFGDAPSSPLYFRSSDNTSISQITGEELDALPEIVDGWKEVTVEFDNPYNVATTTTFLWESPAATAANRFEVLTSDGRPTLATAAYYSGVASYGTPAQGTTVNVTHKLPSDASPTADPQSDAVVLLSIALPDVMNFAVDTCSTPVSGVGTICGMVAGCVPTEIFGNYLTWDAVPPADLFNGTLEIQRADEVSTDYETIAILDIDATSFCDYEARVGVESQYRVRTVNAYELNGPWTTGAGTIAAPGVTVSNSGVGTLIFTSNQDTSVMLAHAMVWDRAINEQFAFPEVGFQELRTQYGRDYFVAFRPTERGGEQFQRTLLINAAAISPPSLGNFHSLRDMAWDTLPYICVRDELGNRWFANVAVPQGNVRRNRRLYLAEVTITEVTDTPAPYSGV